MHLLYLSALWENSMQGDFVATSFIFLGEMGTDFNVQLEAQHFQSLSLW